MAVAVDPFAYATAELSEEYIRVFPNPDIVPKYLETVSDKTGVQLLTGYDSICIKGSWVAIKRVHAFLVKFLASYQSAQSAEEQKSSDLELCEETDECNEEDTHSPDQKADIDYKFHDSIGEQSDWVKWTADVLPRIHRVRSKRTSVYSDSKCQTSKVPEPFVVYASFQPATDPAAKRPPTLDAIEEVLKKVYDKDKFGVATAAGDAANDTPSAFEPNEKSDKYSQEHIQETSAYFQTLAAQNQGEHETLSNNREIDCSKESTNQSNVATKLCIKAKDESVAVKQTTSPTCLPMQELPTEDTQGSVVKGVAPTEAADSSTHSQSVKSNAHVQNIERETRTLQPSSKRKSRLESPSQDKPLELAEKGMISSQEAKLERKTKRKGRPQKNEKYEKKKDVQVEVPISKSLTRAERAAKRRNVKTEAKVETHEPRQDLKSQSKPVCEKREDTDEKSKVRGYFCTLCTYVAKRRSHLREHKRRVHITKEFKCEKCEKVFGFGKDLKRHLLTHKKAENCCDICGKMYKGARTLAKHRKIHETDYKKPEFPCDFCQKTFSTKYVLAYHVKSEHLGMKKTYLCPTCGKSFSQKNSYLQHANVHMGIKPYQCDTCGKSFSYEKSLKEHRYMHKNDKQFECPQCHKKFRQSSGVAIHMKIHKEHKDYVCSACGKGFSQKQALVRHERIHVGEKPFSCSLCQRKFTDSSILRRHMILIHKKDPKKWREDTENNVQRHTDFFISILGEDGKKKKSSSTWSAMSDSGGIMAMVNAEGETSQGADDSCNFIPVGIGTGLSLPLPAHSSMLSTVSYAPISHDAKISHTVSEAGTVSTLSVNTTHTDEGQKEDSEGAHSDLAVTVKPVSSKHSTPAATPSPHQTPSQLQAQASALLDSYAYADPHRLPSTDFYTGDVQQGLQLSQYSAVLAQTGLGYHPSMVIMPDALNFHAEHISVTTASEVQQAADYDTLVSQSMQQHHQYTDTQQ